VTSSAPTVILHHALPPADSVEMVQALGRLKLPFLRRWLSQSQPLHTLVSPPEGLSLPHELALAQSLGWPLDGSALPWAARAARTVTDHNGAWAFITLCHWQVGNGQFTVTDPGPIREEESQTLFQSMQPYFEEDGISLHPYRPGQWLARSTHFEGLASASLERVMGLPIEPWLLGAHLPELSPSVKLLRRLQNEMQMLLYQHPVNDRRPVPINSIWIEGCGRLLSPAPNTAPEPPVVLLNDLREPWLLRDVQAWSRGWEHLDANVLPAWLETPGMQVVWCGQREARVWQHQPPGLWTRWKRAWRPLTPSEVLSCDA
jgi:hypothetical protein